MFGYAPELNARKAALVARCEAERAVFGHEAEELRRRTRWIDLGWEWAGFIGPRLPMLAPVAAFLVSRNLPGTSRVLGRFMTLWQLGKRVAPALSRLRLVLGR